MRIVQKTIVEQIAAMKNDWPGFRVGKVNRALKKATWVGQVQPQFTCYRIEVSYTLGQPPEVRVRQPALIMQPENPEGPLPHIYGPLDDPTLCLYDPETDEWNGSMLISQKIIPWSFDWLTFYEFWLLRGEWSGGGRHPERLQQLSESETRP